MCALVYSCLRFVLTRKRTRHIHKIHTMRTYTVYTMSELKGCKSTPCSSISKIPPR